MEKIKNKRIKKSSVNNFLIWLIASVVYCCGVNLFLVPGGLFSGGFTGIAQLLALIFKNTSLAQYNLNGIIYFIINLPVFIIGWKKLGKKMIFKAFATVALESFLFSVIPIPKTQLIEDPLTNTVIGAVIEGAGCGLLYYGYGTSGGTDIIGYILSLKYRSMTIGRTGLVVNFIVYIIAGIVIDINAAVYSIIAAIIAAMAADKLHTQNRAVTVNILTENPKEICKWIRKTINRDSSIIDAVGSYSGQEKKMIVAVMSQYEYEKFRREVDKLDDKAFIYVNPEVSVLGNFEKRLKN